MAVHSFTGAGSNCTVCKRTKENHTCECCTDISGAVELKYGNMLMCQVCIDKENSLQKESLATSHTRVNQLLEQSRAIDQSIQIKSDIFNAATVPIVELMAAINADENIKDKDLAIAEELMAKFEHNKDVISGKRQELLLKENEQRAIQVNLQNVVSKLSAEIRERFKIADLNYQPTSPKVIKPAPDKSGKKKFQKEEVRKWAAHYNVMEYAVQMIVAAKNLSPEVVARHLRLVEDKKECDCPICEARKVKVG